MSSRKEEQAGVPASDASPPGTEAVEDQNVSSDVADDAMEEVRPPSPQRVVSDDRMPNIMIVPVEFTPGDYSEPEDLGSSGRQHRHKRKQKILKGWYSMPSALSSSDGSSAVLDMDTDRREHNTVNFFIGTYGKVWTNTVSWEMFRGNSHSNSLPTPLDWFALEFCSSDDSSPG